MTTTMVTTLRNDIETLCDMQIARMESYVRAQTAFGSYHEMATAMVNGYVPTIYPTNRAARRFAHYLRRVGWTVYTGR